ncbi:MULTISPECIES: hypothetical protein [Nostocales]|nr:MULTISPECIES: hypothetical protein [Nostocales]
MPSPTKAGFSRSAIALQIFIRFFQVKINTFVNISDRYFQIIA